MMSCVEMRGGCEGGVCFLGERFFKEEGEIREGRGPCYIFNITEGFTNEIIPTVTLLAIISV
jgi:hypothetical protein